MPPVRRSFSILALLVGAGAVAARAQNASPAPEGRAADTTLAGSAGPFGTLGVRWGGLGLETARQTLTGDAVSGTAEPNVVAAMAGRVAGADITGTGASGTSVHIRLRGPRTLLGTDEPLFVVNGMPMSNAAISGPQDGVADYGTMAGDIDPSNIASITVLNGANAAALYGERGQNGAILITTKSARGTTGFGLTARQDVAFDSPLILPDLQNRYGSGSGDTYRYYWQSAADGSWGPPMDGRASVQWWSNGADVPFVAQPDNLRDFFRTGHTVTTSAAVSAGNRSSDIRLNISNLSQAGVQPNSGRRRVSAGLDGGMQILPRLDVRLGVQYAHGEAQDQPVAGSSALNPMMSFLYGGREIDLAHLHDYALVGGLQAFPTPLLDNNPYWDVFANSNDEQHDHGIGSLALSYELASWLTATARTGMDFSHDRWVQQDVAGSIGAYQQGQTVTGHQTNGELDTDLMLDGRHSISERLSSTFALGYERRDGHTDGPQQCTLLGGGEGYSCSLGVSVARGNSVYGRAGVALDSRLFLDVTSRKDWNQWPAFAATTSFSPSASAAFVFKDAPDDAVHGGWLTYGKLRAGWAQLGGQNLLQLAFGLPQRTTSWEEGIDVRMFGDRVSLGATHYDERTVARFVVAPPQGSAEEVPEALSNHGIELEIGGTPVRTAAGFQWFISAQFTRNRNEFHSPASPIVAGPNGLPGTSLRLTPGLPYGQLFANAPHRDEQGRIVMGFPGLPALTDLRSYGSELPDWTAGLENQLRYKQFILEVLLDTRQGGHFFSGTELAGTYGGTLASTLQYRAHSEGTSDGDGVLVPGVDAGGSPNTTRVTAQQYFQYMTLSGTTTVSDASFVTLRELTLTYVASPTFAQRLHLSSMRLSAVGRNLWMDAKAPDVDPETVFDMGSQQGGEFLSAPGVRTFGVVLQVTP